MRQKADASPNSLPLPSSTLLTDEIPCDPKLCGPLDEEEMAEVWSPLATLGDVTPNSPHSQLSNINTTLSSPSSDVCLSGTSSIQTTPIPVSNGEKKFSYSPTASVEGEQSCNGNSVHESTQKPTRSPVSSRNTSGRSSPVKSLANTPRSFRQIVSDMFRRSNAPEIPEDFSNVSVSELDAVVGMQRDDMFTQSDTITTLSTPSSSSSNKGGVAEGLTHSLQIPDFVPSPVQREEKDAARKQGSVFTEIPNSAPTDKEITPIVFNEHSANSFPNEEVLIGARERLKTWKQLEEERRMSTDELYRPHRPSLVASYESLSTLTPMEDESVCSLLLHQTIESPDKRDFPRNGIVGVVLSTLSPSMALDQYIRNGNVLHMGRLRDLSIPELEGINWDHYGGCPHSEELKTKTSLAAMLHSQVLFERHQCQQHARRNRRLMSKARTTTKLENEVLALVSKMCCIDSPILSR